MRQGVAQFIDRLATGRNFIMSIMIWLSYAILIMGPAETSSANNIGPIDLTFAQSPEMICKMIDGYGEDVRHRYMRAEIIWDGFHPLIYGVMLLLGFSYVMRQAGFHSGPRSNFLLAPLLVVGADYCENIGIVTLLSTYPSCSHEIAAAVSLLVTMKWVMAGLCLAFLITVSLFFIYRKIQGYMNR